MAVSGRERLSTDMRTVLVSLLEGDATSVSSEILEELAQRGLVSGEGRLTGDGYIRAVASLPLSKQCTILDLPILKAGAPDVSRPEQMLWNLYRERGFLASHCEGGPFLTLLKAATLPVLVRLNTHRSPRDPYTRYIEALFTIHQSHREKILGAIESASRRTITKHFDEIYGFSLVKDAYPHLETKFIAALFDVLGPKRLRKIGELLFTDPYTFRNGWPDLTLIKNRCLWLVEVKTRDRLHSSQITTIPKIRPLVPGSVAVLQLKREEKVTLPELADFAPSEAI